MYSVFIIFLFVFVSFVIECVLANVVGPHAIPNLLIVLIVFFNLYRGTRYALLAAIFAGVFKDSYSAGPFGLYILAFIVAAFLTTLLKVYVYQPGSMVSRVLLVFVVLLGYMATLCVFQLMFTAVEFPLVLSHVLLPELGLTVLITPYVFNKLRQCALRFFA
jgi:rod shape-determining protein MreD